MNYFVNLVQQGISQQTLAVSGKSGRAYGTATASPADKGVSFKMSMKDYLENAHDLIGNTTPNQQWVPIFVPEPVGAGIRAVKCCIPAGCPYPAEYVSGNDFYCGEHAPLNAVHMTTGEARGDTPTAATAPETVRDVAPKVSEPAGDLPIEQMKSTIGTDAETSDDGKLTLPVALQKPSTPRAEFTAPVDVPQPAVASPTVTSPPATPGPTPVPPNGASEVPSAVQLMIEKVTQGVLASVVPLIDQRFAQLKMSAVKTQKKRNGGPDLAPSAHKLLQQEAKSLGINAFQKSTEQLKQLIAEKKAPNGAGG